MVRPKRDLENKLGGNLGWILVMLLVAGSSFLLGSSVNQKSGSQMTAVESNAPTQSVISDISSTLQNPAPTAPVASSDTAATATPATGTVNINTAGVSELDTLPGIGPAYANAIINYRTANGPFVRIDDIVKIKGIGPKTFEKLKSRITI